MVLRGEAGIGKTRTLHEFLEHTDASEGPPVVVAMSHCVDLGPIGVPFTPVRRLLQEVRAAVGDQAFVAATGNPVALATIAALVPDLATPNAPTPVTGGPDHVAEAIEGLVERLALLT